MRILENFLYVTHVQTKKDAEVSAFPASLLHWAYLTHQERGLWSVRKIYCEWRVRRNVQGLFWEQLRWAHFFTPGREERPNTPQKEKMALKAKLHNSWCFLISLLKVRQIHTDFSTKKAASLAIPCWIFSLIWGTKLLDCVSFLSCYSTSDLLGEVTVKTVKLQQWDCIMM